MKCHVESMCPQGVPRPGSGAHEFAWTLTAIPFRRRYRSLLGRAARSGDGKAGVRDLRSEVARKPAVVPRTRPER